MVFKKLIDDAILPQAQTKYSAGYDVYASEDVTIGAGETKLVPLGIALNDVLENLKNYYFGLYLRSGLGAKGLILPNGVGIIDMDYKGEIKQIIHNPIKNGTGATAYVKAGDSKTNHIHYYGTEFEIKKGDRVGQLILHKHHGFRLLGNKYRKDETRNGGFGSTGQKDA